ncbi:glutathione S-transferase family protein [Colwellia sp. Arc7-635]|uniref:glutathione S-transferase family protein n=1 Tax=Colwellia sp. Arc7-635 TaxID=2497879 RepID=UPI000F84EF07|nr:glutathione S-transferase family protein [Colwellia sp. Arc7-635]AZQ83191.1 glutathione S-transferase family protein [Colwellia sp. Arc7-635]
MIELWHCHNTRSLRVLWALKEMKLEYKLNSLPFPPRFLAKPYLETNPLGTVPFLKDGDSTLTESSAMLLYLAERYQQTDFSLPVDHPEYGAYLNWLFSSDATLTFPQTLVLRYSQFEQPERQQPQVVKDYAIWYLARLKRLNLHLENNAFLVANKFTIADISVGYALYLGELLGLAPHYQPQTRAYLQKLKSRAGFIAIKDEGEKISNYTIKPVDIG